MNYPLSVGAAPKTDMNYTGIWINNLIYLQKDWSEERTVTMICFMTWSMFLTKIRSLTQNAKKI